MSQETKILKDKTFMLGRDMVEETRDGESSMLIELQRKRSLDMILTSDSTLEEHSTSDQECQ
jgi:hypothetical protein